MHIRDFAVPRAEDEVSDPVVIDEHCALSMITYLPGLENDLLLRSTYHSQTTNRRSKHCVRNRRVRIELQCALGPVAHASDVIDVSRVADAVTEKKRLIVVC